MSLLNRKQKIAHTGVCIWLWYYTKLIMNQWGFYSLLLHITVYLCF